MINIDELILKSEYSLKKQFKHISDIADYNFEKVMKAFQKNNISLRHFAPTTGYGYDDVAKNMLGQLFADIFHSEKAIVSPLITCGTHAITLCLFGLLKTNQSLLAITGHPYDTLRNVILGDNNGSLKDYGINYSYINLKNNKIDLKLLEKTLNKKKYEVIFMGRSRGYEWRDALSVNDLGEAIKVIKRVSPDSKVLVDNCYGEFVETIEPTDVGADVIVGSLIKNPGGGIAPTGAYIAGKSELIEKISYRLTAPGLGSEVGSYELSYRNFYQGLFLAPTTVKNALMGSLLFGKVFESMGYETMPKTNKVAHDIIRSIKFNKKEELISFCRAIQKASPIDSNVVPFPWDMPGYTSQVIMAAGAFVQGASIELSCDSPIKKPYIAYLQGGLTYEHVKYALKSCINSIINKQ